MFPAVGQNLKLGRGSLLLAPHNGTVAEDGFIFLGNIPSLEFSWELETREKFSSTQRTSPLLAQATVRQDLSLTAQCDEHTKENLKRFFFASEATANQTLSTTNSVAISDIVFDRTYDLGKRSITNVVVTRGSTVLVNGTDYTLYSAPGFIIFTDSATLVAGDDVTVAFDNPALSIDHMRLGQISEQLCKLLYIADDANSTGVSAGDRYVFWKAQITPDGSYQLISDDYTSFNLKFRVLTDSAHPSDPMGRFERVRSV